jgi:hypothetical protein
MFPLTEVSFSWGWVVRRERERERERERVINSVRKMDEV